MRRPSHRWSRWRRSHESSVRRPEPAPARRRNWRRRLLLLTGCLLGLVAAVAAASTTWVRHSAAGYLYRPDNVPSRPVAVVFGTLVYSETAPSPALAERLDLARRLYERHKVRAILVTGDNGQVEYNEVDPMRRWLTERGLPDGKVIGDYAGFDTYDSCARAIRIFGVTSAVLVTQAYHLPRAVAVCRGLGIDAVGVPAPDGDTDRRTLRLLSLRDKLACVKAAGLMIARPDPRYLGRHETGVEDALAMP